MKRTLLRAAPAALLFLAACNGPGRGWVSAEVVHPMVEALAPYTEAGIEASPELTPPQVDTLKRELEILLGLLETALAK